MNLKYFQNAFSKIVFILAITSFSISSFSEDSYSEDIAKLTRHFSEFVKEPDKALPKDLLKRAHCYAQLEVIKAGFIVGGARGQGLATCRLSNGHWSHPAFVELTEFSFGWQWGIKKVRLGLVFLNSDAKKVLINGRFQFGGEASVSAGPVGRDLRAGVDYKIDSSVVSYSMSKGAFLGLSLKGTVIDFENSENKNYFQNHGSQLLYSSVEDANEVTKSFISVISSY